jgi:hypothetical protein
MFEQTMTDAAKLTVAKKLFTNSVGKDNKWQREAVTAFDFRDGNQWSSEEREILEKEMRPVLTFNLTKSSIDLIMGMNEEHKIRYRVSPTEPTDGFLAEVINDIVDWVYNKYDLEDEENDALESAAISGRGYVAVDFSPDPKRFGEIDFNLVSAAVHEIHFDPSARRKGLEDASHISWDRWIPLTEFRVRYPHIKGRTLEEIVANNKTWGLGGSSELSSGDIPQSGFDVPIEADQDTSDYDTPLDLNYYDKSTNMIRVIHMEYWENYTRYYVWNPVAGVFEEAPEKPTKAVKELFKEEFGEEMTIETVQDKKVKWLQFTGDHILFDDDSPLPYDGFSIVPMFAFSDVSKRTMDHFGIVRGMIDPQKEVNKRWSQTLNMLNNQVQPGIFAEIDAFIDEDQAKQSMKESGGITYLNSGALARIKERDVPQMPNAPMQMEQFSQDIMKKITGINPDLLGQDRGRQEPGVVVRLRQQQGMTILKPLFRNFNIMKRDVFNRLIAVILEYMPDAQILRILGESDRYEIQKDSGVITDNKTGLQAKLRDVRDLEYNVKSEYSPGSMTQRMLELTALMEMMQAGFPVDPMQVIEKMELSASEKVRWIEYINNQQQAASEKEDQMMQTQVGLETEKISVDKEKNQIDLILGMAKINQMGNKDDKSLFAKMAQLDVAERNNMAEFALGIIQALAAAKQAEQGGTDARRRSSGDSSSRQTSKKTDSKRS